MAVKIRLKRVGRHKNPTYNIIIIDSKKAENGNYIEKLGYYTPPVNNNSKKIYIDLDKIKYWISKGAQPTKPLVKLLNLIIL